MRPDWPPRLSASAVAAYVEGRREVPALEGAVRQIEAELAPMSAKMNRKIIRAVAASRSGVPPETISKLIDWKAFEGFCAALLGSMGFRVSQNIILRKPRAQIDILAHRGKVVLLVDCKHWTRTGGKAALRKAVVAQVRRAGLLRKHLGEVDPMAILIVSLGDESVRFMDGAGIVPVHTLRDFIDNIWAYSEHLVLR